MTHFYYNLWAETLSHGKQEKMDGQEFKTQCKNNSLERPLSGPGWQPRPEHEYSHRLWCCQPTGHQLLLPWGKIFRNHLPLHNASVQLLCSAPDARGCRSGALR